MAVSEQIPYVGYTANGNTTEFPITFDLHDPAYLVVTVNKEIPPVGSFTVNSSNDKVIFLTAPEYGAQVELYRDTTLNRDTSYKSYDNSFRPEAINFDFDETWRVLQEQHMIDAKLLATVKSEVEWRRVNDSLLQHQIDLLNDLILGVFNNASNKYLEDKLKELSDAINIAAAAGAGANGWTAQLIADASGKTQQEINDNLIHLVLNIEALRQVSYVPSGLKVHVKEHSTVPNEGGGNFQSFYSETPLTDNNGTLIKSSVVSDLYWERVDFQAITPEMFGAQAVIDVDQAPFFNAMYAASEAEGFICGSVKGRRYRIYTEVDVQGANATYGFTELRYRSNDARLRIRAKSRARFFDIQTNTGYTGNAVYLNGLDNWGTEFQNNMFDDFRLDCPSSTGTAIYLDCTQPSSRIAYAHSTNVRITGFENGLFLHAAATSGWSFINANTFTNYMSGANNKNFIVMHADKTAGGDNDVDSNKLISFEFQNKDNDNALVMTGCKLNQLIGQTYFDLTSVGSVFIDPTSENNFIQGAWLQPFENIGSKNTVINQNNSTTYKSYQKNRSTFSTEYIQRERFTLDPNNIEPVANEGSYFKTANTQATTIVRFRNVLEGKVISIFVDDTNTSFAESAYISLKTHGTLLRGVNGCIYNFIVINGVAVLEDNPVARATDASATIATGTQVFGASNSTPIGRNTKWARVMCDDGVLRMYPVWDIPV